jgi:4a-hydroxytetrahydrobiopterin dehydratase
MVPETGLQDWRKLAQRLHARFLIDAFADGVRFVAAVGEACQDAVPELRLGASFVDVATWDTDLAGRISAIAAEHGLSVHIGRPLKRERGTTGSATVVLNRGGV